MGVVDGDESLDRSISASSFKIRPGRDPGGNVSSTRPRAAQIANAAKAEMMRSLSSASFVPMVKAAGLWNAHDTPLFW
jgi:hypothetical protein